MTHLITPDQLRKELATFTGSQLFYRHNLNQSVVYTEGVRYLAQAADAFWLVDEIALRYGSDLMDTAMEADQRLQSLQFWRLRVADGKGELTLRADDGVEPAIRTEIPSTDFPLPTIDIWSGFNGQFWTLYLPSEH